MKLGLVGKSGSGKDYCASIFEKKNKFYTVALADNIRDYIYQVNPEVISYVTVQMLLRHNHWDDLKKDEFNFPFFSIAPLMKTEIVKKVRILMQKYGEAGRKAWGEDFWINKTMPLPCICGYNYYQYPDNFMVKDIRRINEAERIKELGGYVIKVENPYLDNPHRVKEEWRTHISEAEVDEVPYDYLLRNDTNVDNNILDLMRKINRAEMTKNKSQ